jgi:hypothetical protein
VLAESCGLVLAKLLVRLEFRVVGSGRASAPGIPTSARLRGERARDPRGGGRCSACSQQQ